MTTWPRIWAKKFPDPQYFPGQPGG